jgi:hypothetical protein
MKRFSFIRVIIVISLRVLLIFASSSLFADNQEEFVKAYFMIQEAEQAQKLGNIPTAQAKTSEASMILNSIAKNSPDWDPKMVSYYLDKCRALELLNPPSVESVKDNSEKLVPSFPALRETETNNPVNIKPAQSTSPIASSPDVEKKLSQVEQEIQIYRESNQKRLQAVLDENKHLKNQSEQAEKELNSTKDLLLSLQKEKKIGTDLLKEFQTDLDRVETRLHDLDIITKERVNALSDENEMLKANSLLAETQLSKTQALLESANQEVQKPSKPQILSDSRLQNLEEENKLLKHILGTLEDQLINAKQQIVPAVGASNSNTNLPPVIGRVALIRSDENFVVVHFQNEKEIPVRAELGVYRNGQYVGSVRIVEPVRPPFASATILSGKPILNDLIR